MSDYYQGPPPARPPYGQPQGYDQGYEQGPGYAPAPPPYQEPAPRRERYRDGTGSRRTALIVHTVADIAAGILALWIVLYALDANQANPFVEFVHSLADGLGWWAQDIFTMDQEMLRTVLNFGLPALIYLAIGHGIAARLRHLADS